MTLPERFAGRVVLVTGGTSGIGLATARRLLSEGATVVIAGRDPDRGAEALCELDSPMVRFEACDVADRATVDAVIGRIAGAEGRLDALVNSAGAVLVRRFEATSPSQWQSILDVNLTGVFHCCQAALPLLRRVAATNGPGSAAVVNVTSLDAVGGDPGMSAYNAAKAGALNLTRSLALELAPHIRVNSVAPGAVDTPSPCRRPTTSASAGPSTPPSRWGASAGRRRSPPPWRSSPPTTPASSPAPT